MKGSELEEYRNDLIDKLDVLAVKIREFKKDQYNRYESYTDYKTSIARQYLGMQTHVMELMEFLEEF